MTNSKMNPKVDEFLSKAKKWQEEYSALRNIVLDCEIGAVGGFHKNAGGIIDDGIAVNVDLRLACAGI